MTTPAPRARHLVAGAQARARLAELLGVSVDASSGGWHLESVESDGSSRITLMLRRDEKRLQIALKPKGSKAAFTQSRRLSLCYVGEAVSAAIGRYLEALAARLGDVTLADIMAVMEADPETIEAAAVVQDDGVSSPSVGGRAGSRAGKWWNFYADQDFAQEGNELVWTGSRTVTIGIGERECRVARPRSDFRRWSFLNYPHMSLPNAGSAGLGAIKHKQADQDEPPSIELREADIIMGTRAKEEELIEAVRRRAGSVDLILTGGFCTPAVMGVDLDSLARRCEEAGRCLVLHRKWNYLETDPETVAGIFRKFLEAVPKASRRVPDRSAVNLFDFPTRYRDEELRPFLSDMGLRTNACILPEISVRAVRGMTRARGQVFRERQSTASALRPVFEERGLLPIPVETPYGIRSTRRCLSAIAAASGRGRAFTAAWKRHWTPMKGEWDALSREARGHRLGFVIHERFIAKLADPALWRGVPFLRMLAEMGFGLDILIFDPKSPAPGVMSTPPRPLAAYPGAVCRVFRSPAEMDSQLAACSARAFFSDIYYDSRLTRAGKAQFSQRNFEMGLGGALRCLRSLLAVCRLPFYERYAAALSRDPEEDHA